MLDGMHKDSKNTHLCDFTDITELLAHHECPTKNSGMAWTQEKAESHSDPSATLMKHISRMCHGEIQTQNTKISSCCEEIFSSEHIRYIEYHHVVISLNAPIQWVYVPFLLWHVKLYRSAIIFSFTFTIQIGQSCKTKNLPTSTSLLPNNTKNAGYFSLRRMGSNNVTLPNKSYLIGCW